MTLEQSTTQKKPLMSAGKKRSRDEFDGVNTTAEHQKASTSDTKKRKVASSKLVDDSIRHTANKLLKKYGSLPLSDLGLPNPSSADRENVLALIYNAMLTSARISHELATKSVKCLIDAGYQDIDTLTRSTWEERTEGR